MGAIFKTTQTLWYKNGVWGDLGYAVPNFGLGAQTMNATIRYLVSAMGRNLSGIVHDPDADLRTPPSINTITQICKLIDRARKIIGARTIPDGQAALQTAHVQPGVMDQLIFPVPFFRMRNQWIQEYTGLILAAIAEACQHTENRQPFAITSNFSFDISQLLQEVYKRIAVELLQIDPTVAGAAAFVVTPAMLSAYNRAAFFTGTEMIDVSAPPANIPTGADLQVLTDGIPASKVIGLALWPDGTPYNPMAGSTVTAAGSSAGGSSLPGLDPSGGSAAGAGGTTGATANPTAAAAASVPAFTTNPANAAPPSA